MTHVHVLLFCGKIINDFGCPFIRQVFFFVTPVSMKTLAVFVFFRLITVTQKPRRILSAFDFPLSERCFSARYKFSVYSLAESQSEIRMHLGRGFRFEFLILCRQESFPLTIKIKQKISRPIYCQTKFSSSDFGQAKTCTNITSIYSR